MSLYDEEGNLLLGECEYYLGSTERCVICLKYGLIGKIVCKYCQDRTN